MNSSASAAGALCVMKWLVWSITLVNIYFGGNALLNALGVLQSSKYARSTTVIAAVLFLGMGAYGAYTAWTAGNLRAALWIGIGPWVLMLVVLFLTMILSNPR